MASGENLESVVVKVSDESGGLRTFRLSEGETVIVGEGSSCGIQLSGQGVAALHCVLRLTSGELQLQNWGSDNVTSVDGAPVDEDATLRLDQTVQIGTHQIQFSRPGQINPSPVKNMEKAVESSSEPPPLAEDTSSEPPQSRVDQLLGINLSANRAESDECVEQVIDAPENEWDETPIGPSEDVAASVPPPDDRPARIERRKLETKLVSPVASRTSLVSPEADPEMLELLRAEVDCLQAELAERDRQLLELQESQSVSTVCDEQVDAGETERLLARLEDLLDELSRSDERVRTAEELLLAEQEVTRSQQEEQQEIQNWITEIEDRIEARELEWKAERETLNRRLEVAKSERDEVDRRLSSEFAGPEHEEVVQELRAELDKVRETLDVALRREEAAIEKLKALREQNPGSLDQQAIESATRAERLRLAEERAALSRERAEVAKLRAEMDNQEEVVIEPGRNAAATDSRFNEFRKTLRELHEEDRRDAQTTQKTLGRRIADLWARLDGKIDTV